MPPRRVLFISNDAARRARFENILKKAGGRGIMITDPDDIQEEVVPYTFVFYDWDGNPEGLDRLLPRLKPDRVHVACVVPDKPLGEYTALLQDPRVNHVLVDKEAEEGVYVTAKKLISGDIFGIEKYLPDGTHVHYIRLRDYKGRSAAIDTVVAFAEKNGIRSKIRHSIAQVCEELLMNALYDAPVDDSGRQIFAELDPHDRTETKSPKPVSIRYAASGTRFAIAVRDRFGRLDKNTILAYIQKCLTSDNQIDRKTYGAGLGLYLVANAAAGYVVNVAHGMATEVICTFERGSTVPLRTLGVFVHPGIPTTGGETTP